MPKVHNGRLRANKIPVTSLSVINCLSGCQHPRGSGGYSIFFRIRRLGPSIYRSPPKNIRNFKYPQKVFEIVATQKIPQFCTLTLKKTLKCIEMILKLAQFCDDPKTYPQNLHTCTPQKYSFFSNPQKY